MVHKGVSSLSLNSKRGISSSWLKRNFFNLIDYSPLRPGRKIVFESFNAVRRTFNKCFYTSIRTVAHITHNLVSRCRTLRKETIPDALHFTAYQKLSSYSHPEPTYT